MLTNTTDLSVLILVLMEDGLWRSEDLGVVIKSLGVLILVLMEDGLWHG